MDKLRKLNIFKDVFSCRNDIVASYNEQGWRPIRLSDGRDVKIADLLLYKHLKGEIFLGIYPLKIDNTCRFIAADFDNHNGEFDPYRDAVSYFETCACQEIQCYILKSKSGTGYHGYIFFETDIPAWKARTVASFLVEEAGLKKINSSFDKFFPAQNELSGRNFGNLISLPFQGNAAKDGCTIFLNPASNFINPYKKTDQFRILSTVQKISESNLDDLIKEYDLEKQSSIEQKTLPKTDHKNLAKNRFSHRASFDKIINKCNFVAHCRDDSYTLSYDDWWSFGTIVVKCIDGERLFHKLSENYPTYTIAETDNLIKGIKNSPAGPHTCSYIASKTNNVYCAECEYKGKIKSPIKLGLPDTTSEYFKDIDSDYFENNQVKSDEIDHEGVYLFETDIDFNMGDDWSESFDDMEPDDYP